MANRRFPDDLSSPPRGSSFQYRSRDGSRPRYDSAKPRRGRADSVSSDEHLDKRKYSTVGRRDYDEGSGRGSTYRPSESQRSRTPNHEQASDQSRKPSYFRSNQDSSSVVQSKPNGTAEQKNGALEAATSVTMSPSEKFPADATSKELDVLVAIDDSDVVMTQATTEVPDTSEKDLVEIMLTFGNSVINRAALESERCSAKILYDRRIQECLKMESEIAKFPAHKLARDSAKERAEEHLRAVNEKCERSTAAMENYAALVAAQIMKAKATQSDKGRCAILEKKLQAFERAAKRNKEENEMLDKKVQALEQAAQKDKEERERYTMSEKKIQALEQNHQSLCRIVEEQDKVAKEFQSTRNRFNNHEKTTKNDIHRISTLLSSETAARLELQKKSDNTAKKVLALTEGPEGSIQFQKIEKDIESVSRIVQGVQQTLDTQTTALTLSNEKLKKVDELENYVVGSQNRYNDLTRKVDALKVKIDNLEKAPTLVARPADVPTPTRSLNPAMIGVIQTTLRDVQRNEQLLKDRVFKLETQDNQKEERIASLEKLSTVTQDLAEWKQNSELHRLEQTNYEKATDQRFEDLNELLNAKWLSMKGVIDEIRKHHDPMSGKDDRMNELSRRTDLLEAQFASVHDRQEGISVAVTHLTNRFANVSTAEMGQHIISQIETTYPNIRNMDTAYVDMRRHLSQQQTLNTQFGVEIASLRTRVDHSEENTAARATSIASSKGTESMRQEIDSLTKDMLAVSAVCKNIRASQDNLTNIVNELKTEFKTELGKLKEVVAEFKTEFQTEFKTEFKTELKTELGKLKEVVAEFKTEFKTELGKLKEVVAEFKTEFITKLGKPKEDVALGERVEFLNQELKGYEAEVEACLQEVMPRVDAIEETLTRITDSVKSGKGLVLNTITNNRSSIPSSTAATESDRQSSVQLVIPNRKRKQASVTTNGSRTDEHSDSKSPTRKRKRRGENEQSVTGPGKGKKMLVEDDDEE